MMAMAQANAQRIAGIDLNLSLNIEQYFYHVLDLRLFGIALADQRLLDLTGGIFINGQIVAQRRTNRRPPGLPQLQGGIGIFMHEDLLDRHLLGSVKCNHFRHAVKNLFQALWEGFRIDTDAAAGNIAITSRYRFDNAIAGNARAGVYT